MNAFPDPAEFAFLPALEAAFPAMLAEAEALAPHDFAESPDSLTTASDGYDERGWRWFPLFGGDAGQRQYAANRVRCPATARAVAAVPGMVNASLSLFRPGTHLYPHRGEMQGVLRCHLPLVVPAGNVALRAGGAIHRWQPGRGVIFDDTFEHDAWNRAASDRIVLIVTFTRAAAR